MPRTVLTRRHFTEEILPIAPWFFEMRELIAQRPNLVPAGLGNSASGFDDDVLGTGPPPPYDSDSDAAAPEIPAQTLDVDISSDGEVEGRTLSEINDDDEHFPTPDQLSSTFVSSDGDHPSDSLDGNELEDVDEDDADKKKKKGSKGKGRVGQTPALPGTSTPAPTPVPSAGSKASKKSKVVEFAEIAKTEELTRQKELDLATLRAKQSMKALEVKHALDEKREERKREDKMARREERRAKLKMREMKLQHTHELRMAQLAGGSSHAGRFFDPSLSMYTSSAAQHSHADSEYGDLGSVSGRAGSSTESSFDVDYQLPSLPPFP
ncbi:hypothetical protein B0H19DRAFT_1181596 [Mycena capillaripes]|nr:hypothetical protein B0H19DRAFT_1181596 [Mycena capillaripes]